MSRIFNFSAGPAMLPDSVMRQAQEEFMNWNNSGMSVMEISHRSKPFLAVADAAEQCLRDLLSVPDNYHVLFMHGGSQGQFAAIPLNLMGDFPRAAYVQTGVWGEIAVDEAQRFFQADVVASSEDKNHSYIPAQSEWADCSDAAYLHYVDNETVNAVEFSAPPKGIDVPLVADMSSNLLSRPVNVKDFGLIYACAQKNLGPSGITVVIVRDDLLKRKPHKMIPRIFDYRRQAENKSMVNTPSTFPWYMIGLVAQWVKDQGGLEEMHRRAMKRSEMLYQHIDQSDFYINPVEPSARSRMNVVFTLKDEALSAQFLELALEAGMSGLKGHRFLGGMRASMYNAMPQEGVETLLDFMKDFEKRHG